VVGFDIFVAWRNHSAYGIDKLDYTQKVECATLESRIMSVTRETASNFGGVVVAYYNIPENTAVEIYTSKNYENYIKSTTKVNATNNTIIAEKGVSGTTIQLKLKMIVSGNEAPEIESAGVKII
jgi:hypothetical protein